MTMNEEKLQLEIELGEYLTDLIDVVVKQWQIIMLNFFYYHCH